MKKLLVTSALPYANGSIHLGHLVEYIQTDIWVRYWRLRGRDAIYLCADDTHGTPIMMKARDVGIAPEELIAGVWKEHTRDFAGFQIRFDRYYSTHSDENRQLSAGIYEALREKGHIAEKTIEQAYCDTDGMFLPDRFVRGKCPKCGAEEQYGDACEVCSTTYSPKDLIDPYCAQCGTAPSWRESVHLFFKLGDFAEPLQQWLEGGHVQDEVANKLREWFESGLQDWDISRDAPYFGFEIPDQPGKYFYVWLDAPVGYMAATLNWLDGDRDVFDEYWKSEDSEVYHFIGKDIIYFHALFWPAMLMGSGHRTPTQICAHGFLTVNGEKMSKQRGTFINAETYLRHLDPQYLRYYYATKLNAKIEDLDLSFDDFVNRVDADLVNTIANIPSRVLAILHKNCDGKLTRLDDEGRALVKSLRDRCDEVATSYEEREFGRVTRTLIELATEINVYLQGHKPWQLAKEGDLDKTAIVCTSALNAYKIVATLIQPILPDFASKLAVVLGLDALTWDGLDGIHEEQTVQTYDRLVARVDKKKIQAILDESKQSLNTDEDVEPPTLSLDALVDTELQALTVVDVAPVEDADKLVLFTLEGQADAKRNVVAGLGWSDERKQLTGKTLVVVANLEPKKLRGQQSQGMILAADVNTSIVPLQLSETQGKTPVE